MNCSTCNDGYKGLYCVDVVEVTNLNRSMIFVSHFENISTQLVNKMIRVVDVSNYSTVDVYYPENYTYTFRYKLENTIFGECWHFRPFDFNKEVLTEFLCIKCLDLCFSEAYTI